MATVKSYGGELSGKLSQYRSLGLKEAAGHRPISDAAAPDQHETALRSDAESWLAGEQQLFDRTLTESSRGVIEAQQKRIELRSSADRLMADESAESTVAAELAGDRASLVRLTETRLRAEVDLNFFRESNGISEEARYPDSLLWHFGVLAMLIVVETVINAFFYENSQGLLGGLVVAFGIAIFNMATAVALGYFWRFKNLASVDKKVLGWSAAVVFLVVAVFCNALFAAFRTEYQLVADPSEFAQMSEAFKRAWTEAMRIFRADMSFQDHWSFLLFGLGILLSGWAFHKGYTLDDRFPGHGVKDRAYRIASDAELQRQDLIRQKIRELLHHRRAAVQAALHEPTTYAAMLARKIADLTHARAETENRAAAVLRDYALVIETYRSANTSVRVSNPPPYFSEPKVLGFHVDCSSTERVVAHLTAVQDELRAMAEVQRDAMNAHLNQLQVNAAGILNQTLTDFFASVEQEAHDNIARMTPTIHRLRATS